MGGEISIDKFKGMLRLAPWYTTEKVSVIRCRDCKYYDETPSGDAMMCYCGSGMRWPDPKDYCSKGELKRR